MRPSVVAAAALLLPSLALAAPPLTTDSGAPIGDNQNSKTAGPRGGVLLEDFQLIEKLARFDRERIPERVVHARGAGAYGEFVSAGDFGHLTRAKVFSQKGKRTPIFVRFSTVIHGVGSPETLRDPRGFALKLYTEEGNWDLVGNNLPVFFIRDAKKFPDMVHALKPSPVTNRQDPNRFFDFFSHVPESTHMLTRLYADRGIPADYRRMDGHAVHAFKLVDAQGGTRYAKLGWKSRQGVASLTAEEAALVQGRDFQHATKDLYDAIAKKQYPSWDLEAQIIEARDLDRFDFDPLDPTKVWPEDLVKPVKLGTFTLNRAPTDFFAEVEQAAFSPGVLPPGIEPSEDRLLQGRLFSYADTQRYRIGANYLGVPVNQSRSPVRNHNQGGALARGGAGSDVNYEPSITRGSDDAPALRYSAAPLVGTTQQAAIAKTNDFAQAGAAWRALDAGEQERLVQNLAADLGQVKDATVKARMVSHFLQADRAYGERVAKAVGVDARALARVDGGAR